MSYQPLALGLQPFATRVVRFACRRLGAPGTEKDIARTSDAGWLSLIAFLSAYLAGDAALAPLTRHGGVCLADQIRFCQRVLIVWPFR